MKKNNVLVLLSTYNGERYLEELIESLLNQRDVNVNILVRDDGSKDRTVEIIKEYMKKYSNIDLYLGENLGYAKSFWNLVKTSSSDYDYYAFCDQDDIWEENKIISAIQLIEKENKAKPVLYTSNVKCVNNNKEYINYNAFPVDRVLSQYETFQKSILPGCTFVFNNAAKKILEMYNGFMESHDWATYAIITTFGKVIYDKESYILYRVHDSNTIGIENKFQKYLKKMNRFFSKNRNTRSKFAKDFYMCYEKMLDSSIKEDIRQLAFYREKISCRIKLLLNRKYKGIIFKLYVLLNKV